MYFNAYTSVTERGDSYFQASLQSPDSKQNHPVQLQFTAALLSECVFKKLEVSVKCVKNKSTSAQLMFNVSDVESKRGCHRALKGHQ